MEEHSSPTAGGWGTALPYSALGPMPASLLRLVRAWLTEPVYSCFLALEVATPLTGSTCLELQAHPVSSEHRGMEMGSLRQ